MLVQFTLKNYLSFKDETILDMAAISAYKEHDYNLINSNNEKFLKVAAIYGANASGKSNLVLAFNCFQTIITESFNNVTNDKEKIIKKNYTPYMFDKDNNPTEFEVIEIINNYEYKYGFEYNDLAILREWMYRKNLETNRRSIIFERNCDSIIEFGASIRKECEMYSAQIPSDTLILSFFNKLKMKTHIFSDVYDSIMDTLVLTSDFYEDSSLIDKILPGIIDTDKKSFLDYLTAIDSGIKDIWYKKSDKEPAFFTVHFDESGNTYDLPLFYESEGTIKCIVLFMYVEAAVIYNKSLFIDELNVKLHPLLMKFVIDMFYDRSSLGQLLYTTHDTILLDKKFFRRDQIWFVQKDNFGHSKLYALSDFKVRSDASFEKDYLGGVYGGIPLLKEFNMKGAE